MNEELGNVFAPRPRKAGSHSGATRSGRPERSGGAERVSPAARGEGHHVEAGRADEGREGGFRKDAGRARRWKAVTIVAAVLAVAAIAVAGWLAWRAAQPDSRLEPGAYLIPQGDMTDEEAQALVDEIAESSRITISVAGAMELSDDGRLRVNFVVPEGNNGLSERLEVEQGGRVVCRTGVVGPGYMMEWAPADGAGPGPATATVHAVSESGADSGNPTSVEVEVVPAGEGEEAGS